MSIQCLRNKKPQEIYDNVKDFKEQYVEDWDKWLAASADARPELFGRTLRKWQAFRPYAMRRLKSDPKAKHEKPFLDDILKDAEEPLGVLYKVKLLNITHYQNEALKKLWKIFSSLRVSGEASCVGITKAILLMTNGKIGPAFDSTVRKHLGINKKPSMYTCGEWLKTLKEIGDDIYEFEKANKPLSKVVPNQFAHLGYGRLYDMVLGPR